jgi:plastocyanin
VRKSLQALSILLIACGLWQTASAGEIKGRILITKVLTKKKVSLPDYQMRGVTLPREPESGSDEFSRLVIYLDDSSLPGQEPTTRELVQKGLRFIPQTLVIPLGSTVSFPNQDEIFHNVFSLSKAKQLDLGYYPAGETRTVTFNQPGVVQIYCHIHRDMSAAILVVPNQWYVQPEKDGRFSLPNIPAGTRRIVVWHRSAGFFGKRVEVPETGAVELSLTIPVPSTE